MLIVITLFGLIPYLIHRQEQIEEELYDDPNYFEKEKNNGKETTKTNKET